MKIKTNNVPQDCDYLTNGKEYEFTSKHNANDGGTIIDDDGEIRIIFIPCSSHLDGASWEIVK